MHSCLVECLGVSGSALQPSVYTAVDISVTTAGGESARLEAGSHRYPFMFMLPPTVPSSFEGEVGYVRYTAEATMERPWKFNHVSRSAFTVISLVDLNMEPPEFKVIFLPRLLGLYMWSGVLIPPQEQYTGPLPRLSPLPFLPFLLSSPPCCKAAPKPSWGVWQWCELTL